MGLLQATAANMLEMIGIGPFITIPLIIAAMGGPQAMIGWILGAVISICDGLVWAELGAAMPGSLGANPSATIAAIAERNVRRALKDPASPIHAPTSVPLDPPLPGGPSLAEIRRLYGQTPAVLDPIAQVTASAPEPHAQAIGLTFTEVMQGFYTPEGGGDLSIRADLVATIDDLSAFLSNPRRPVAVEGTVRLVPVAGQREVEYAAKGTLDLLKRVEAATALRALFDEGIERLDRLAAFYPEAESGGVGRDHVLLPVPG